MLSLLANWRLVVAGGIVAVLIATHAFAYWKGRNADEVRQMEARLEKMEADYVAAQETISDLRAREGQIERDTRIIEKEVVRYVPDDRACDLGPDALRLLRQARGD